MASLAHLLTLDGDDCTTVGCDSPASPKAELWKPRVQAREFRSGDRFGKYELLEEVGRGMFGVVFRAKDTESDQIVALKIALSGRSQSHAESGEVFMREACNAFGLRHPAVVATLEAGRIEETWYLASELIDGVTLEQNLTEVGSDVRESARLLAEIAEAVQHVHDRGVVHRDLKPANILIDRQGRPHIADFGLSRRTSEQASGERGIVGTPAYMSPEQAVGDSGRPDVRGDVYSLGVMLYQLLAGRLPFQGPVRTLLNRLQVEEPSPLSSVNPRAPRELETICLKAMAKSPDHRYPTVDAMASDLREFLDAAA